MASVFVPDVDGWERAFKSKHGMVGRYIANITGDVAAAIKFEAPGPGKTPRNRTGINYGKGVLMNSIVDDVDAFAGEVEGTVTVLAPHAKFVIGGTKPHVIRPRTPGGMLRFFWWKKGKMVAFRHVNHPGTAENDFMLRGLKKGCAVNGIT